LRCGRSTMDAAGPKANQPYPTCKLNDLLHELGSIQRKTPWNIIQMANKREDLGWTFSSKQVCSFMWFSWLWKLFDSSCTLPFKHMDDVFLQSDLSVRCWRLYRPGNQWPASVCLGQAFWTYTRFDNFLQSCFCSMYFPPSDKFSSPLRTLTMHDHENIWKHSWGSRPRFSWCWTLLKVLN
jgi:hypothetical protein